LKAYFKKILIHGVSFNTTYKFLPKTEKYLLNVKVQIA